MNKKVNYGDINNIHQKEYVCTCRKWPSNTADI